MADERRASNPKPRKNKMKITVTGGRKSSQQRNAVRQLGIALNGNDPSEMVASGHRRHHGMVRSNPDRIEVTCDLATAQAKLAELVAADKHLVVHAPFNALKVVEVK